MAVRPHSRQKRSPPPLGVQSNEDRAEGLRRSSRLKTKICEQKQRLARKKCGRKVKESFHSPERTPSLSPRSVNKVRSSHKNLKTVACGHKYYSDRKGRKLDLPAAAKDLNMESGRPPYRGGEPGGGRVSAIPRSSAIVDGEPYERGTEMRSTRKKDAMYREDGTASSPHPISSSPSSRSSPASMSLALRRSARSDSVDLSSEENGTPSPRSRAKSPSASAGPTSRKAKKAQLARRLAHETRSSKERKASKSTASKSSVKKRVSSRKEKQRMPKCDAKNSSRK